MNSIVANRQAGFAYLPGDPYPFSNGVVALDGHALTRVRLRKPLPLAEGLAFAASFIAAQGRPLASMAACELRSPAALSPTDFVSFNANYVGLLRANGFGAETGFPVGRSNMAPLFSPPATNVLFAFTYTVLGNTDGNASGPDFLISGKPEIADDPPGIVAPGDVSPAGMAIKASHVIVELERRVQALGGRWTDITGAQAYTIHSLDSVMDILRSSGLAGVGLSLFPAYPPVVGLDFEIDVRSIGTERAV